jgi:hypothetical protein
VEIVVISNNLAGVGPGFMRFVRMIFWFYYGKLEFYYMGNFFVRY